MWASGTQAKLSAKYWLCVLTTISIKTQVGSQQPRLGGICIESFFHFANWYFQCTYWLSVKS